MADFDLNAIINSLTPEDIENLKTTAASVLGGMDTGGGLLNEDEVQSNQDVNPPQSDELIKNIKTLGNLGGIGDLSGLGMPDLNRLSAILPILQAFNSHDQRLDFINALKPLLSEERRKKADEAVKLVKLMSVLPLLRERGIM